MGVPLNNQGDVEGSVKGQEQLDTMDIREKPGDDIEKWSADTDGAVLNGGNNSQMDTVSMEDIKVTMDTEDGDVESDGRHVEMNGFKPREKLFQLRELAVDTESNLTPKDITNFNEHQEHGVEMDSLGSATEVDDIHDITDDDSEYREASKLDRSHGVHFETVVDIDTHHANDESQDRIEREENYLESVIVDTPKTADRPMDKTGNVEPLPEEKDDKVEKEPRSRKVTVTSVNRFCVEQVSLNSKSSLKKTDTISSDTSSVPSDIASQNHTRFYLETNTTEDIDDDEVFTPDGFDNLGYSDNNDEDDDSFKPSAMQRSMSLPGLSSARDKHQPELRRCDSHGNTERVVPRKDSVVMMKQHFKKKPKLLKYDESIQQWVERHMTPERAPIRPPRPNDHLPLSCAVLLCCNIVFGAIALVFSLRSNRSYEKGEYADAKKSSRTSLILSVIGVIVTIVVFTALLIYFWPTIN